MLCLHNHSNARSRSASMFRKKGSLKCGLVVGVVALIILYLYAKVFDLMRQTKTSTISTAASHEQFNLPQTHLSPPHLVNYLDTTHFMRNNTVVTHILNKTEMNIEQRFSDRKHMVEQTYMGRIEMKPVSKCEENAMKQNLLYVKKHNMVFCAIEKTGSTFWRRLLHIAGSSVNGSNPTHIATGNAYSLKGYRTLSNNNWTDIKSLFESAKSIMFVRDPFSKLFSGWLDKFYSPNVYYWKGLGKKIVNSKRNISDDQQVQCGFDVSFAEFVDQTVTDILKNPCIDVHFAPNYKHCMPHNFTYDYIGKYETFEEDTMHLIKIFNLTNKVQFDDFEKDANMDAIKDGASWVFSQRKGVENCNVSFTCALFRVWERLRSRGVIGNEMQFPYNNSQQADSVTRNDFEALLTKAYHQSNAEDLKHNRNWALHQAFLCLPKEVVIKVEEAFAEDFRMYIYNLKPIDMFPDAKTDFTYFKPCPAHL